MRSVLISLFVLGIVLGASVVLRPEWITGASSAAAARSARQKKTTPKEVPVDLRALCARELEKGYAAYDRGDFSTAATFFRTALGAAQDTTQREKAQGGLHRSVFGIVIVSTAQRGDEGDVDALVHDAEMNGGEDAWLVAARAAKMADDGERLAYCTDRAVATAVRDGTLEAIAHENRKNLNSTAQGDLVRALQAHRLDVRGLRAPGYGGVAASGGDDSDTGGIGGSGDRSLKVPFGSFSAETRRRLKEAVKLEAEGRREYELASPDNENRQEHRKAALKLLYEARDIYDQALEEDRDSRDLEKRYASLIKVIAALRRDSTL